MSGGYKWTPEEESFLLEVFRAPNLDDLWSEKAKKEGWPMRTHAALIERIRDLGYSRRSRRNWSPEEDFLLLEIFRSPHLESVWNQRAKKEGWPMRSHMALKHRIHFLGESLRYTDESAGWVTGKQLQRCLGTQNNTLIGRWKNMGLPAYRDGDCVHSPIKIHLADFVAWALGAGMGEVAKVASGDRLATEWLLRQIADWKDYKTLKLHSAQGAKSRRREDTRAAV